MPKMVRFTYSTLCRPRLPLRHPSLPPSQHPPLLSYSAPNPSQMLRVLNRIRKSLRILSLQSPSLQKKRCAQHAQRAQHAPLYRGPCYARDTSILALSWHGRLAHVRPRSFVARPARPWPSPLSPRSPARVYSERTSHRFTSMRTDERCRGPFPWEPSPINGPPQSADRSRSPPPSPHERGRTPRSARCCGSCPGAPRSDGRCRQGGWPER
jgi:hypothetical protein